MAKKIIPGGRVVGIINSYEEVKPIHTAETEKAKVTEQVKKVGRPKKAE